MFGRVRVTYKGFERIYTMNYADQTVDGMRFAELCKQIGEAAAAAAIAAKAHTYEELSPYMPRWEVLE